MKEIMSSDKKKLCFVIMGFGKKKCPETNRTIDLELFALLFSHAITLALEPMKYWIQVLLTEVCMLYFIKQSW